MIKKNILGILALCSVSLAADAATIIANQKKAAFPDTAEVRMRTTVAMQGMPSQVIESRMLTKGKEKTMTEIKSPMIGMRIVRNGERVSVTDLKTGASMPTQMAAQAGAQSLEQDLGKPQDYLAPVKEGGLWRMSSKDPAGATLFYSEEQKRVVKILQTVQPGVQSETNIKYCYKGCALPGTPASIDIATQMNGQSAAKISIEVVSAQKLASIPDALFEAQGK
ncbi:MAG: hypothetical protein LBH25_04350 [Fibromonadaceae bacterium]|jgi:hypothetical protein|nr:hypothetical protein [Fibromonadaceae bacterium]